MDAPTKVVFRKFKGGEVIALFPREIANNNPYHCESYMHVGQHGAADTGIVHGTSPATPEEYAPLKLQLERIGYNNLIVQERITRFDLAVRKQKLEERYARK